MPDEQYGYPYERVYIAADRGGCSGHCRVCGDTIDCESIKTSKAIEWAEHHRDGDHAFRVTYSQGATR